MNKVKVANPEIIAGLRRTCAVREYRSSRQWLASRRRSIGASEAQILFGCGYAGQTPYSLFVEKVSGQAIAKSPDAVKRMRRGTILEGAVAQIFAEIEGMETYRFPIRSRFVASQSHPVWAMATLDGLVVENNALGTLELKQIGAFSAKEWRSEGIPTKFLVQVQHQLLATGLPFGYLAGWISGDTLETRKIEVHDRFRQALIAVCDRFYHNHVVPGIEAFDNDPESKKWLDFAPPMDGLPATTAAVKVVFPSDDKTAIEFEKKAVDVLLAKQALAAQVRLLERRIEYCNQLLIEAMGPAGYGIVEGNIVAHRMEDRAGYTVEPKRIRVLRTLKKLPEGVELITGHPAELLVTRMAKRLPRPGENQQKLLKSPNCLQCGATITQDTSRVLEIPGSEPGSPPDEALLCAKCAGEDDDE